MKVRNLIIRASSGKNSSDPIATRFEQFRADMEAASPTWGLDFGVPKLTQAMLGVYVNTKWDKVSDDYTDIEVDWMKPTLHLVDADDPGTWYSVTDALHYKATLTVSGAAKTQYFSISFEPST